MDDMGGLPQVLDFTAKSLCIRGDGRVTRRSKDSHYISDGRGDPPADELRQSVGPTSTLLPYSVTAGDSLDCVWGAGYIAVSVNDEEIFRVEDSDGLGLDIGRPPS